MKLKKVKAIYQLSDSRCNFVKLFTLGNLVECGLIPLEFKLQNLKRGEKEGEVVEEEEKKKVTPI